jgi:hypothetical protein
MRSLPVRRMALKNKLIAELLQSLDLGAAVAEFDGLLEVARVETSAFSDLMSDRVDLVPGTKGSGKSALFRMIVEFLPGYLIGQRKVVVAHGVQAPGDPVFQAFSRQFTELTEEDFIDFWCIYLVSLAYEQFIKNDSFAPMLASAKSEITQFRGACSKASIPEIKAAKTLRDVLAWSLHVLATWKPALKYNLPNDAGELELDLLGNPKQRSTPDRPPNELPKYVSEIREALEEVLKKSDLSLWLMVDRLDEVFPRRSEIERRALRGLLRAMRLFTSNRLRVKIFLRDDMLDNLVKGGEGFTALTHVTARKADTLRWDNDQILAMLAKRFFSNKGICASLDGIEGNYEQRVVRWLIANQRLLALDPHVVYRIRCAFLHNGTGILGEEAHPQGRLTLLAPPVSGLHTAQVNRDGTRYGDVRLEVDDIVSCLYQAAGRWAQDRQGLLRESEANGKLLAISPNPVGTDMGA